MLDAVLLDWECVLVSTAAARRDALSRALADEGATRESAAKDATVSDLVALRASRHFAERLGKGVILEPGAREFVERIQLGSRLAVVTRATRPETEFVLRLAGLDGAASAIVTANDDAANDFRAALDLLAKRKPLSATRSVAIVSSGSGLRQAKHAALRAIAIGMPAHAAIDADGSIDAIDGMTLADLARIAGLTTAERTP
ncbi:MAG: family hydrolase [Gemmatimonadetes bacterium]|nr:family hydrolase [Gemmatimonadota bacterium]